MWRALLLLLLALIPSAARAEWREATSKHFIVYSDTTEEKIRAAITNLEKYDFVLRWAADVKKPPSPIKLKVYLLQTQFEVKKSLPEGAGGGVLGYYNANARNPFFVGLARDPRANQAISAQQVLFHEYTHHFMFQYFPATYSTWYSEGFAEFYGTTRILDNDVIEIGHPAEARYYSLLSNWLPLNKMLTAKSYADVRGRIGSLYAQGWLLVHYLSTNKEREGQLDKYLHAINAGKSYEEAMDGAFGKDAKALNSELRDYSGKLLLTANRIPFKPIDVGPITVRTLGPAERELVKEDIFLNRGLLVREAREFLENVRATARRYPTDPFALQILTEAERASGNAAEAAAAVDRWLAVKPKEPRAMMHKAQLQIESLAAAKSPDQAAWDAARNQLLAAHKAAPRDPMILEAYYDSYVAQGVLAPPPAQNALFRAFELVPQDDDIRYKLALDFEHRNMIREAIHVIKPAALSLHGENESEADKKKRAEMKVKYREVGTTDREEAWEMLARLEKKLPAGAAAAAPATSGSN
jgi:hypothetical protein